MVNEFLSFLKEYKVIALAVALVMGTAATGLVNSLVNDVMMPIIAPLFGSGSWKTAMLDLGPVHIAYGSFLAQVINFVILALIIFLVTKKLFKEEQKEQAAA